MPAHLKFFNDLLDKCSDELEHDIMEVTYHVLFASPRVATKPVPNPSDMSLSGLRDYHDFMSTPMGELYPRAEPTRERINERMVELMAVGIEEGFLVTSLVYMLEYHFAKNASSDYHEKAAENNKRALKDLQSKARSDSPENASVYESMMTIHEEHLDGMGARLAEDQSRYVEWSSLLGNRLQIERGFGSWMDLLLKDVMADME